MKCWILSSDSEIASTKRLVSALEKAQVETEVLNPLQLHFEFGARGAALFKAGKKLAWPDFCFPRLGWETWEHGLRVCRFLESAGVLQINSAASIEKSADKLLSLQIFHGLELPVPQTRFTPLNLRSDLHLLEKSKKHVFKTLHGSQGFGVTWQETKAQSQAQVDAYRTIRSPFLVQELIEDSVGEDIRAFVIQGEVKASMKRKSLGQDLRSNLHQGGSAKPVRLTALEKDLVLSATEGLGLFYAGVDFLRTKNGPLLLEANPSPGFEGISKTCRVDLAEELVQALLAP